MSRSALARARRGMICVPAIVVAIGIAGIVAGQELAIRGKVVDQDGAGLVGVTIEVMSPISPDTMKVRTKKEGAFIVVLPRASWEYTFRFLRDGYHEVLMPVDPRVVGEAPVEVVLTRYGARLDSELPFTEGGATTLARPRNETITGQRRQAIEQYDEGVSALEAGDAEAAEAAFVRATIVDPRYPEPYRALAAIAEQAKEWRSAARAAKALLRFEPDDLEAKWTVYNAMLRVGTEEKLASAAHRLASADRRSVARIASNARDLFDIGDLVRARALAEVALESAPNNPDASFVLGMSCSVLGDTAAAKAAIELFLELAPADHPDVGTAIKILGTLE